MDELTAMEKDRTKSLYRDFLESVSPCESCVCDSCGWIYSHPLNYCAKCPGKIMRAKLRNLDRIKFTLEKDRLLCDYLAEFANFYEQQTGNKFPFNAYMYSSHDYYDLTNVLRERLGRRPVDLALVED